jgi:hypothetical protein
VARINIEDCWWTDPRRSKLIKLLGSEEAADGTAVRMWRVAQEFWGKARGLVPLKVWNSIEAAPKLIQAGLAEEREGGVYVSGSSQYLDWAFEKREAARAGGQKSAQRPRNAKGQLLKKPKQKPSTSPSESKFFQASDSVSVSGSDSGSDSGVSNSSNSTNAALAAYCERFKMRWGVNPQIQGKDSGIMGRVAKGMSPARLAYLLDAYFSMPDAGLVKAKHPLNLFELKMNEVVVFAESGQFTTHTQARQADNMATNHMLMEKLKREGK